MSYELSGPLHGIQLDFEHSSQAKLLYQLIDEHRSPSNNLDQDNYLSGVMNQLVEAIELMESVEG